MPLELTKAGVLPVAVHDGDLDEIEILFGGFQRSNRRMTLFAKLKEYVTALRNSDIRGWLIVDGSFVMGCVDEPEDIDVILILAADWDLKEDLRPFQYNLVSKRVRRPEWGNNVIAQGKAKRRPGLPGIQGSSP
ncbi:MAG: hypothetical protein K9M08_11095 [Pirellula sp.]|nr:hypothetical protein [Pirellula sp.]